MLEVPGPVGGVVAGCTTGAEREAVVSGSGGVLGTSDGEMTLLPPGVGFDGVVNGAGLGMVVWPTFFSSA
jgi:hypothetical protein